MKANKIKAYIKIFVCALLSAVFCLSFAACFEINDTKFIFNSCGGTPGIQTAKAIDVSKIIDPVKENLEFGGWFWDKDEWQKPFTVESMQISSNKNVYAKWLPAESENIENENTENENESETEQEDNLPNENTSIGLEYELINGSSYAVLKGKATADRITIPDIYRNLPVTKIAPEGFKNYTNLKNIDIPDSIKTIGMFAFIGCSKLESIDIPDGTETIDSYAFQSCSALKTVIIGKNTNRINGNIFYGCSNLESVTVNSDNETYISEGDCLIRVKDNTLLTGCYNSVIPDGVTKLDTFSFSHMYGLKAIVIPASVAQMGMNVFNACPQLKIYAEAAFEPIGWGYHWNPNGRPVAWNYKGEPFDEVVFEEPYIDADYDSIQYDIKNATCEEILIKYYTAFQEEEIGVKTLTYGTVIAFGNWAFGTNGNDFGIDNIIKAGRERSGFGCSVSKLESSPQTIETISYYWALIKPIISDELHSENFSDIIYSQVYVDLNTLDFYIDKMISGIENGKLNSMDCIEYIDAVFAASYGKLSCAGPKLSTEIAH